jgi:ATP/maltotriose-dependent transcriptional regulator MalT
MLWIAPSEKDAATNTLQKRLRDAVDQFRANSGLKAGQYSQTVAHKSRTKILLKFIRDISTKMRVFFFPASVSVRDLSTNSSVNSGI